ncbi:hypothetical protein AAFF_G00259790 [Aldrovandia affinis]|uniref:Uncharacterized protein n=1 Tax=Aldrovandia affinis TaxID=143900 RepID=A0AAD7W2Z4_9TELE|nr:hypothetical protein AAFF_G00259790 [Aldrovandia affinis]
MMLSRGISPWPGSLQRGVNQILWSPPQPELQKGELMSEEKRSQKEGELMKTETITMTTSRARWPFCWG